MEAVEYIGLAMGLAWASGINLYATIAVLGIMGSTGAMELPPQLVPLLNPTVIIVASFMYCVEFVADKTPGVDSGWDAIHTFIRIPAGAILAAQVIAPVSEEARIVAFLLGGAITASAHITKASGRALINTSPEPFSNWGASISEDIATVGALWLTFNHPYVMIGFVVLFFLFALWIIPKLWRTFKVMFRRNL